MSSFSPIEIEGRRITVYTRGGHWHPTPAWAPSMLSVSGDEWRVLYHDQIYGTRSPKSRLFGFTLGSERVIVVDPTLPQFEVADTIAHEFAHAVIAAGRATERDLCPLTQVQEEALCRVWARELTRSGWQP